MNGDKGMVGVSELPDEDGTRYTVLRRLERIDEDIVAVLLIILVAVVVLQIYSRFVLNDPVLWTLELAEGLFVWLVFVGGAVGVRRKSLQSIDVVLEMIPGRFQYLIRLCLSILMIAFVLVMIVHGWFLTNNSWAQTMPTTGLPRAAVFIAVPLSGLWMLISICRQMVGTYMENRNG